jgi:glycosyltransferase involved in cell wall biosynthesis
MKIIHVITDLKIGGESKHLVRVLSSLSDFEHVVACLALTTDPANAPTHLRDEIEELGVPVVELGVSRGDPLSVLRAFARLERLVRRERPDVIHATLIHANLLSQPLAWLGWPLICSHVVTTPWPRNWQRTVERQSGKRSLFLANAHAVARTLVEGGFDSARIRVLHYGVDCEHFRPEGQTADLRADTVLLGVGRLHPQKNFECLISAAEPLRANVVLVGDGPLRETLEHHARTVGVNLSIVPPVDDIAPFLRRADAVVLPSLYEGLPNVLLEALATGCSVVATDLPGHREVIRNDESGILAPVNDAKSLSAAIRRALSLKEALGVEGRRTVLERFQWDTYIARRRMLYEAVGSSAV